MVKRISVDEFDTGHGKRSSMYEVDEPNHCPMCKYAIDPVLLAAKYFEFEQPNGNYEDFVSVMYLCRHCGKPFITYFEESDDAENLYVELFSAPKSHKPREFPTELKSVSPQFVKIYNQALAAEVAGLDEICGIGYRRALEFLIKDYCILANPGKSDEIKAMPLSKCIKAYIQDDNLIVLATRSVWLGNDATHYVRKHEDYGVADMKKFIDAFVYYISMQLAIREASSINPA